MRKRIEENYTVEGRIDVETAKAYLIEFTNLGEPAKWVPKSVVLDRAEAGTNADGEVLWQFTIKGWFAEKESLA